MKMKLFGMFAAITGVLAFLLVLFITGPIISDSKQRVEKRGIFASVSAEFSGKAAEERANINRLAAANRVVFIGGTILVVVGAGAWLVGAAK